MRNKNTYRTPFGRVRRPSLVQKRPFCTSHLNYSLQPRARPRSRGRFQRDRFPGHRIVHRTRTIINTHRCTHRRRSIFQIPVARVCLRTVTAATVGHVRREGGISSYTTRIEIINARLHNTLVCTR